MLEPTRLGAALYVPATSRHLLSIASGNRLADIRTIIFCTEDSVSPEDMPLALSNLKEALQHFQSNPNRHRFIRVRNPAILGKVLEMAGVEHLDGFVLPKVTAANIDTYIEQIDASHHCVMPTLETREVFSEECMRELLGLIDQSKRRKAILCLRIGGNDLLSLLRIRRPRGLTIYQTPIGQVIARLATTFIPYGFVLTAPVFDYLNDPVALGKEIQMDLSHGLVGKTAIHPLQVPQIESHYRVLSRDLDVAMRLLDPQSPSVFKMDHAMQERATNSCWAQAVVLNVSSYGCESEPV